jgi:hypothetical protein
MSFDRALASPAAGDVYLDQASVTCSTVEVGVVIANLNDIYTVGFDLNYPSGLLEFSMATIGPLMVKDHPMNPPAVIVTDTGGTINVGVTRLGTDPAVNAVGSETVLFLRFLRVAPGAGNIDFDMSASSGVAEAVINENKVPLSASFGPGHGGVVTVP